ENGSPGRPNSNHATPPPTRAPTIPSSVVARIPIACLPGTNRRARAPTINPAIIHPRTCSIGVPTSKGAVPALFEGKRDAEGRTSGEAGAARNGDQRRGVGRSCGGKSDAQPRDGTHPVWRSGEGVARAGNRQASCLPGPGPREFDQTSLNADFSSWYSAIWWA